MMRQQLTVGGLASVRASNLTGNPTSLGRPPKIQASVKPGMFRSWGLCLGTAAGLGLVLAAIIITIYLQG